MSAFPPLSYDVHGISYGPIYVCYNVNDFRVDKGALVEYTYLQNVFFVLLHNPFVLMFIYCRHRSFVAKLFTLHRVRTYFSLYFIKYSLQWKIFQIKVVDLNEIYYIYIMIQSFLQWIVFENFDKSFIDTHCDTLQDALHADSMV
jgi:hypothetical protein